jgi:HTH-type transcriptional regulator/antitoxin HipB
MILQNRSLSLNIPALLIDRRNELALSQDALATRAGSTQASVSRLERGLLDPQLSTVIDLARALELELRLIPREALPAIDALLRALAHPDTAFDPDRPLYALDAADEPQPDVPAEIE